MALNNPAARLHNVLTLCKQHQKEMAAKPMVKAWRKVLGLGDDVDDIVVMSRVGLIYLLPSRIGSEIKRFDDLDQRLYLGWQNDLAQAFTQISFGAQFNNFVARLSDSLLINIEFCAHELAKRCPEKILNEDQLHEIKESATKLYEDVRGADLEPELSRYLLDRLYLIIDGIDNYLITGSGGLETALDAIVGTIISNSAMAQKARESPFGKAFWGAVHRLAMLLDVAQKAYQLGEGVAKFLPGK